MKCEHCGKPLTNFDRLKACRNEGDVVDLTNKICAESKCPLGKWCHDDDCLFGELAEWLFGEAE